MQHTGISLDIVLILELSGTWCNVRRNALMGDDPEKVSNMQRTEPNSYKQDQRGRTENADMTIYAIGPARLAPTMCHHQLPTTIDTSATHSLFSC